MEGSKIALQKHQTVKQKAPECKKKKKKTSDGVLHKFSSIGGCKNLYKLTASRSRHCIVAMR